MASYAEKVSIWWRHHGKLNPQEHMSVKFHFRSKEFIWKYRPFRSSHHVLTHSGWNKMPVFFRCIFLNDIRHILIQIFLKFASVDKGSIDSKSALVQVMFWRRIGEESWWHPDMATFSTLPALCEGNPPVTCGFSSQWTSNAGLWCFLLC